MMSSTAPENNFTWHHTKPDFPREQQKKLPNDAEENADDDKDNAQDSMAFHEKQTFRATTIVATVDHDMFLDFIHMVSERTSC